MISRVHTVLFGLEADLEENLAAHREIGVLPQR